MKVRNFTPHAVHVVALQSSEIVAEFLSEGNARVSFTQEVLELQPVPIVKQKFGEVTGLPEQEDEVMLIVSRMVAAALPERNDLLVPGNPVRNEAGIVVGCKGLSIP